MTSKGRIRQVIGFVLVGSVLAGCGGYDPTGPEPEAKKTQTPPTWTNADVDRIVNVSYESIPASYRINNAKLPANCNNVSFLRFKTASSTGIADADAAVLLVPGVLEGANAFEYFGRQLVYLAKTEQNKDIEIWAMDRRSNCIEDLTGLQAAEQAATAAEAEDILLGYYYSNQPVNGKFFDGFKLSGHMPYLTEFGMAQTTSDMFDIIEHYFPDPVESRKKVFVGGHSLGGSHTSVFLSWDRDGDPLTTADQGANRVAGAIGFDTYIGSVLQALPGLSQTAPMVNVDELAEEAAAEAEAEPGDSSGESVYRQLVASLNNNLIARNIDIPLVFNAEVIALPEALGILAAKAPDAESTAYKRMPKSLELANLMRLFNSRNVQNVVSGPQLEDFRYTNEAMVGLIFDDHFSVLSFLQISLGHLNGGPVVPKFKLINNLRSVPFVGDLINAITGSKPQHVAANAGPDMASLGTGPLYSWADMDEIAAPGDSTYVGMPGDYEYTNNVEEMVRMDDFVRALYKGPTNLTEWYFPVRILVDILAVGKDYSAEYGLYTFNMEGYKQVPTLLLTAEGGVIGAADESAEPDRILNQIILPGQSHLDPMFATVNTPQLHSNEVASNFLNFVMEHAQ